MATETWYIRQLSVGGVNYLFYDKATAAGQVTQATSGTGWTVAKLAAGNYASLSNSTEVSGTFSTTIVPNTTAPTADGNNNATAPYTPPALIWSTDSITTLYEYNGYFPASTWTFTFPVIAVTSGGAQDGNIVMRVFKARRTAAGTGWQTVTELTAALLTGTVVTNLATAATQNSVVTWNNPEFYLNDEFLVIKIGWQITGAGGANAADVLLRHGAGCTMVSGSFKKRSYSIR